MVDEKRNWPIGRTEEENEPKDDWGGQRGKIHPTTKGKSIMHGCLPNPEKKEKKTVLIVNISCNSFQVKESQEWKTADWNRRRDEASQMLWRLSHPLNHRVSYSSLCASSAIHILSFPFFALTWLWLRLCKYTRLDREERHQEFKLSLWELGSLQSDIESCTPAQRILVTLPTSHNLSLGLIMQKSTIYSHCKFKFIGACTFQYD